MAEDLIAWDTCVVIDAIQKPDGRISAIQPMIDRAEAQELGIAVSTISLAETIYLRDHADAGMPQAEQDRLIERWFDEPFILKRNADPYICTEAAKIARVHRIAPPDAIILVTALSVEADVLITYDGTGRGDGLLQLDGQLGIEIKTPDDWSKQWALNLNDTR